MYELDGLSCERIARQSGQPLEVVLKYLRLAYREPDDHYRLDQARKFFKVQIQVRVVQEAATVKVKTMPMVVSPPTRPLKLDS